ncbi:MAG: polysaccharide deacetylase family protein [Propionibacteriales bacterium]|nr:polysaccharide deacetylase family protein [Propionibacteriales bacterium]
MTPAAVVRRLKRIAHGVPILMYHLVADDAPASFVKYSVTPRRFAQQVTLLAQLGYQSVDLDDLLAARNGLLTLPKRPVVITFDDGYRDCLRHAAPVLHAAGLGATMYLVAGLLGGGSRWMAPQGLDLPLVSAAEARELEQAGVKCQSHALSHSRLATLDNRDISRELDESRRILEDALGHQVRHIAYPHGSYDERVQAAARESGYLSACSTRPAKALFGDDVWALPRVIVDGRDHVGDFVSRLVTSKDAWYYPRRLSGRSRGGASSVR